MALRFPQIFEMVADGRLHLIGVVMLGPHLTGENVDERLAAAAHCSKAEIEVLIAGYAPRPDLPTAVTPIEPSSGGPCGTGSLRGMAPEPPRSEPATPPPPRVKPLSPERYGLQLTITQATRDKLDRAQALLRHANPSGDLADVIDGALDALLTSLEKKKFGATARPRAAKARPEGKDIDPRHVSAEVRRAVHERDGEQCTFRSLDGVRCTERGFLELDHIIPVARGGRATVDNLCLRCRAHNQYEAERILGADLMRAKRKAAAARRADAAAKRLDDAGTSTAPFDADVTLALRTMGFRAPEVEGAMTRSAERQATTFEERIRAALAELPSRASRCSEGRIDSHVTFVLGFH